MKNAVLFDIYGTLIDIRTDESDPSVYSTLSRYLAYRDVKIQPDELRNSFVDGVKNQISASAETYPEADVHRVFDEIIYKFGSGRYTRAFVADVCALFRSLTIRRFGAFSGVYDVLSRISVSYATAIVSDAQWVFTEPEISMLGLDRFFRFKILSSRYGIKKPDARLFRTAMERLGVTADRCIYIGDNIEKDLVGAKNAGMRFLLFRSEKKSFDGLEPDGYFNDYYQLEDIIKGLFEDSVS